METRRDIIKGAIAAVACALVPPPAKAAGSASINPWVLVAEEHSDNGWRYPPEALEVMAKSAIGTLIVPIPSIEDRDAGAFARALGVVTHAAFHDGAVWIIPKWFKGAKPNGFIAPWGWGKNVNGSIEGYTFDQMVSTNHSGFANATRISSAGGV